MERPDYKHPFSLTAEEIWGMEETQEFPSDIECHYKGLLNLMDVLYYRNGNSFYPEIKTRHTAFFLALSMPSFAKFPRKWLRLLAKIRGYLLSSVPHTMGEGVMLDAGQAQTSAGSGRR